MSCNFSIEVLGGDIVEEGTSKDIYLPEGKWYNFFTGEVLTGGKKIRIHAEYNQIPVFVKERYGTQ